MKEKKLIVLFMLFVSSYTLNAQEVWIDGILYKLIPKGNVAEVIGCDIQSDVVTVPGIVYYEGKACNVITISSGAFRNKNYKSIQLPESITSIGESAFLGCTFESITIPDNVTYIGTSAFEGCRKLKSINFGKNVQTIGSNAFRECELLSSIVFPDKLKIIGSYAFSMCKSLKKVTIGHGLEEIMSNAFSLTTLEGVHISDIGAWCNISFENNPLNGANLYLNDELIENLIIPSNVEIIKKNAFWHCKSLKSVTIQNGVKSIEPGAFWGCESLSNVFLPNSITTVSSLFGGCNNLKSIVIPEGVENLYDFSDNPNLISISLPNTLLSIGGFNKCTGLRNINLPPNLEKIHDNAFEDCTSLLTLYIPSKVSEIGQYAFRGCSSLETLTIESGVGKIGYYAFSNCEKLINVDLDAEYYSNMAFDNCDEIKKVYLGSKTKWIEGIFKNSEKIEDVYCYATEVPNNGDSFMDSYIQYITLHVPGASIEKYNQAPWPWDQFKEIVAIDGLEINSEVEVNGIKYKVTSNSECEVIHKDDYSGDIVIPEIISINNKDYKVTSISKGAFQGCTDVKTIQIANSVTTIGRDAFRGCTSLIDIYLPDNLTVLDTCVLSGCTSMELIKLPVRLERIELSAINGCSKLKTIEIPEMVSTIGGFAFQRDNSLETVVTSKNLKEIYYYAFDNCISLKTVVLGESVEKIGKNAFSFCHSISNIYILNPIPPAINLYFDGLYNKDIGSPTTSNFMDTFEWETYTSATLYVPIGSKETYQNNAYWGKFTTIIEFDPSFFDISTLLEGDVNGDGKVNNSDINAIVDYIMNGNTLGFNFQKADINGDQKVNAADIVQILNIIKAQ